MEYLKAPKKLYKKLDREMRAIAEEKAWRSQYYDLKERLVKLITRKNFSAREIRVLKRLMKKQLQNDNIDWDYVCYHFPGKTPDVIMEQYQKEYKYKK